MLRLLRLSRFRHVTAYALHHPQDPGKLRVQEDGVHFKSTKTGKTLLVRHVDISEVDWLRVAKGFEVKLITVDGQIRKFDGFKESVSRPEIVFVSTLVECLVSMTIVSL